MKAKSTAKKNDSVQQKAKVKKAGARGAIQTQTEEMLQHSDLLWQSIFSAANDAIMILDDKYNIIVANQKASQMYGLTEQELAGMNLRDLRAPAVKDSAQLQMEDAIRRGGMLWETIHQRKDGTLFPVEVSTKSIVIGTEREFIQVVRDISDRKQAEEARREAEKYLHTVLNNAPITIFAIDRNGVFRLSEGKGLERAGLKPGENVGVSALELYDSLKIILPDGRAITGRDVIERVLAGETLTGITELNNVVYDNQFVPLNDSSGQVIGMVGVATDITERNKAEETLKYLNHKLELILNTSPLPFLGADAEGRITSWNRAAEKMFGWTEQEAIGKVCPTVPEEFIHDYLEMIQRAMQDDPTFGLVRYRRKRSGTRLFCSISATPQINSEGKVTGVTIILDDITERVKGEEKLKKAHEELRALTARLSEVEENERRKLTRELHDRVGQTLTVLNINLNIIRDQVSDESAQKVGLRIDDSIQLVEDAVMHMRNIMADLHPHLLDDYGLTAALRWYADRFSNRTEIAVRVEQAGETETRLSSKLEAALFRVAQEALTNVALHAQAKQLIVRLESSNGLFRMTVEDDGRGFDPSEEMESDSRSGWGLQIIRERIEAVGGSFKLDSAAGRGTRIIAEIDPGLEAPE